MKRYINYFNLFLIFFVCSCASVRTDNLADGKDDGENNVKLFNPRGFLSATQLVFEEYYRIHGNYPKKWSEIPKLYWRQSASDEYRLLPDNFCFPDSNSLSFEMKSFFKVKKFTYVIGQTLDDDYLINSENNANIRNWACDKRGLWWFFSSDKLELIAIDSFFARMHTSSVKIKNLDLHFQHERAFEYLFAILEDSRRNDDEKIAVAWSLLDDFPHLERFSSYSNKLNDIVSSSSGTLVSILKKIDREFNGTQHLTRKGWKIIMP